MHSRGMLDSLIADPMDTLVGQRVRQARLEVQMTAASLAACAGITSQQLSKFELGHNRIHIGQLWLFAQALGRPVDWFFETPEAARPDRRVGRKTQGFFKILETLEPESLRLIAGMARMLATTRPPAAPPHNAAAHPRAHSPSAQTSPRQILR
ncbi:helix-turn-helix domain-containing protein [Neoroseomonas lacus]|uniref:helix-turn-helix domain-containing protein n=1 Tax=Neoroseomonas lacus TaxID=287609 RepID=UPI003570EF20